MFCSDISSPIFFIFSKDAPQLLYYSHIPAMVIVLLIGIFVFIYERKGLVNQLLFLIAIVFLLWAFSDLVVWTNTDSRIVNFFWSIFETLNVLLFALCLYFTYSFLDKKDTSLARKIAFGLLLFPVILISSTSYNISYFNLASCESNQNYIFIDYVHIIEAFYFFFILYLLISRYKRADFLVKKQILYFAAGIILFLASFFITTFIAVKIDNFQLEQYGLFGMVVFMGFLAYLIVKFKAFNIKLLGAQALVAGLLIGIGSQFFFIQNPTNRILNAVTFCIALGFGYFLVRSVKLDVQRKEELENLSTQLAMANDKLHQLDKAKSEFISIASHQLRTPLTSIKGFTSLLLEGTYGEVPKNQKAALEKVYVSNERLIQLVEDLLNISRIDAGRMEFDFQQAQIEDLVHEAVDTLELSAKNKNLYLHWGKPEKPLPKVSIDITKIKEVISNMIDNAIKYTQKGGVTVRVGASLPASSSPYQTENKSGSIRVIVSDTGIGMDQEEIDMIFNKFQRGREVSHYHTDGTGLGMYIGRKVVEAHKGRIFAESDGKNKGSRFILELPINIT